MRLPLIHRTCWLLPVVLAGCTNTAGPRLGGHPGSRSIAVVGDRPMPSDTGEPGPRLAAEIPDPVPRPNPRARISGRVVDDRGKPVAGATVRLADGKTKGGKDIRATTDRAGGFTLNGLRPGSTYSLIAETDDDRGPRIGRSEAMTAETGVEISLASPDEANSPRPRPGRASRARPISSRDEDESRPGDEAAPALSNDDLLPPDEADRPEPERRTRPSHPKLSAPEPAVGWKKGATIKEASTSDADPETVPTSSTEEAPPRPSRSRPAAPPDDGPNPLPPAIESRRDPGIVGSQEPEAATSARPATRRKVGSRSTPQPGESGELALAPEPPGDDAGSPRRIPREAAPKSAAGPPALPTLEPATPARSRSIEMAEAAAESTLEPGPDPLPSVEGTSTDTSSLALAGPPVPTASPPQSARPQDVAPKTPAPEPVLASTPATASAAPTPGMGEEYNPFLLVSAVRSAPTHATPPRDPITPTRTPPASSLPAASDVSSPAPEDPEPSAVPPRKKWGDMTSEDRPRAAVEPPKTAPSLVKRIRGGSEGRDASTSLCSYDSRLRRVVDFRLPDLEGKPVKFQDLDADYVLLDFWGTWCPPCLESIPHLVALQKQYGPRRLRVVGIACEQVPPEVRRARVEEVSRRLGINYAVLLSGMDGKPCPVQQALQIQAYPTTVLLDRQGRVLWRDAGSTPATKDRLDRVLAALSRGDTVRR